MRVSSLSILASVVLSFTGALLAGPIHSLGDQDPSGVFAPGGVADSVRGWKFLVNADINVTQLGAATPHPEGASYTVVLWDFTTQTQLATSEFTGNGGAAWQWNDLASPVALESGSTYLISIFTEEPYYYYGSAAGSWRPTGTIEYLDLRYANSATVATFPTEVLSDLQYGIPDIGYDLVDSGVPEPATFVLAGFALAALFVKRRA